MEKKLYWKECFNWISSKSICKIKLQIKTLVKADLPVILSLSLGQLIWGSCKTTFKGHIFSFKSASKCISENGPWQWFKALLPSAATSHHNADSNQVTLHLSATNNLVTTKWIAINLSIRIYNFISTIFLNWLHYFEEQLSFILSFGGQMCTMAGSWTHNRKPYFNFTVVSRISLLQGLQPVF